MMMKCGCSSNGAVLTSVGVEKIDPLPICITHQCTEPMESEPDLTGRKARCSYFGKRSIRSGKKCESEVDSSTKLAFFKHCPQKDHDEFYCGCFGWD